MQAHSREESSHLVPLAPALNVQQTEESEAELAPLACVTCTRRKVKCDKRKPCSSCRRSGVECDFPQPAPRKRKRAQVENLQERLQEYEQLLKENNLLPKDVSSRKKNPALEKASFGFLAFSAGAGSQQPGTLISRSHSGKTRYINSNIWKGLGEDLHSSSDEEDGNDDASEENFTERSVGNLDPASAVLAGASTPGKSLLDHHPNYDDAMKLWKYYVRNVEPIIKVIHLPTGFLMVQNAASNPSNISKGTECLIFAIYHFAIVSLTDEECQQTFGQPLTVLQRRYHNAARQALLKCSFLKTTQLAVVQAYTLFLLSVRNIYDPHTFWILTGISIRIAQRIGLHMDGEELGLNPFDTEIRRRLWWQMLRLDGLAAQLSGTGITIPYDSWTTKQPLNINDDDIWPDMKDPPQERNGATDMISCAVRGEIGKFHQKAKPALVNLSRAGEGGDTQQLEMYVRELENNIEENFIRYCDITIPVHYLSVAMARIALNYTRFRLKLHQARDRSASSTEKKDLFALAIKILDHGVSCHRNANTKGFLWHMRAFLQWDPLIWILNEIRNEPSAVDLETAWEKIDQTFASHLEIIEQKRSIDVAMARLALKAWDATKSTNRMSGPEPGCISALRNSLHPKESSRQSDVSHQSVANGSAAGDSPEFFDINNWSGDPNFGTLDDLNADVDWAFWDQLIHGPQPYPRG